MLRLLRFFVLLTVCVLLSSCTAFNPVTDDLMQPPRLTAEQKAINDALDQSALTQNYSLKYPKSGEFRSAFVFHDVDGDGENEAIVFYEPDSAGTTRLALLDRQDGVWRSLCDLAGEGADVEFIAFANLTAAGSGDIVIGWSGTGNRDKVLSVYTYADKTLKNSLRGGSSTNYTVYLIDDIDRNGQDEIFLFSSNSRDTRQSFWVSLIAYNGERVSVVDRQPLSERMQDYAGVKAGQLSLSGKERAVFVDELLTNENLLATEVFTVKEGKLVPIISYAMEEKSAETKENGELSVQGELLEPDYVKPTLYELTQRANTASAADSPNDSPAPAPVCADINGDQVVEIPTVRLLPGYEKLDETERLYLTEYNSLEGDTLTRVISVAINRAGGYRVEFPEEWIGAVTIVSQPESGEWRLIGFNGSKEPLNDLSVELARIRVVSQKDYQDKFLTAYHKFNQSRGIFTYYGFVPKAVASPLAISWEELQQMFTLL